MKIASFLKLERFRRLEFPLSVRTKMDVVGFRLELPKIMVNIDNN